jgi:hypothetical protein
VNAWSCGDRWIVVAEDRDCWGVVWRVVHTGTGQRSSLMVSQRSARHEVKVRNRITRRRA